MTYYFNDKNYPEAYGLKELKHTTFNDFSFKKGDSSQKLEILKKDDEGFLTLKQSLIRDHMMDQEQFLTDLYISTSNYENSHLFYVTTEEIRAEMRQTIPLGADNRPIPFNYAEITIPQMEVIPQLANDKYSRLKKLLDLLHHQIHINGFDFRNIVLYEILNLVSNNHSNPRYLQHVYEQGLSYLSSHCQEGYSVGLLTLAMLDFSERDPRQEEILELASENILSNQSLIFLAALSILRESAYLDSEKFDHFKHEVFIEIKQRYQTWAATVKQNNLFDLFEISVYRFARNYLFERHNYTPPVPMEVYGVDEFPWVSPN